MARKPQKRTLQTREKLLDAARAAVAEHGFEGARVDDIVARAGVAKGTFFAHFRDKDALMDVLIGAQLAAAMEAAQSGPVPRGAKELIAALAPVHDVMTCERYVFDIILRYSGAAGIEQIGPIAMFFGQYINAVARWLGAHPPRADVDPGLMAEGVQAFAVQAMALTFCALHQEQSRDARLRRYLDAWFAPGAG
ncbi:MAG: TetR/AcrR family transcriptional regulator [Pseudomonadota bacterium]